MDFQDSPEAVALRDITAQILSDHQPPAAPGGSAAGDGIDWAAYRALADAGVVGIALPAEVGGGGLGLLELHYVLEQIGAHVASVPVYESIVLGALTLARHGSAEQRAAWLPDVAAGRVVLTAALDEPGGGDPRASRTRATATGGGWRLSGRKSQVPLAAAAARVLVPAAAADGATVVVLVDPSGDGVTLTPQQTVGARPCFLLDLDEAPVAPADVVGRCGADVLDDLLLRADAALCSVQAGVCASALRMAADYTGSRHQFGRPVSSFQAVGQRLADAYIDAEAVRLTAISATACTVISGSRSSSSSPSAARPRRSAPWAGCSPPPPTRAIRTARLPGSRRFLVNI
jgi:alkylation response protein AidB-like acyl-CoA dehydrogenase